MTTFVAKTVGKKVGKKYLKDVPFLQNPNVDDSFQVYERGRPTGMSKQGVWINPGISEHDYLILKKVKHRAYILDNKFGPKIFQFGLSNVVGLIPGLGDGAEVAMSAVLIVTAMRISGDKNWLFTAMCWNVFIDFLVGLVPILGDFGDVLWRSNTRNAVLLEKHLTTKAQESAREARKAMNERAERRGDDGRRVDNRSRSATPPSHPDIEMGQVPPALLNPEMAQVPTSRRDPPAADRRYQNMVEAIAKPKPAKINKPSAQDSRRHRR